MRFALLNDIRSLPAPGLGGACSACGRPVIAKCGAHRMHHWAHRGRRACDPWWEPETDWHRHWKMQFPEDQQEVILTTANGEKHIADVRTAQGLVLEFQYSHIRPEERAAREAFHQDLVWVVNGVRLQRDWPRFSKNMDLMRPLPTKEEGRIFMHPFPEESFPQTWLQSRAPVFFDFKGAAGPDDPNAHLAEALWCLLPQSTHGPATIMRMTRAEFILYAARDPDMLLGRSLRRAMDAWHVQRRRQAEAEHYHAAALAAQRRYAPRRLRRRF